MSDTVIRNAEGILTGLRGSAERSFGDIRIRDGIIIDIGKIDPLPNDNNLNAKGCVAYPGLISTHHHLFQSIIKAVKAGINLPLEGWILEVPSSYWYKIDGDALNLAATLGISELLLSGCTAVADHHYIFPSDYSFDPAEVIFEVAERLGIRFTLCRGGGTRTRQLNRREAMPIPTEPLDVMIRRVGDLAARFNNPAPDAIRRVVFAPNSPAWSVTPAELGAIAVAARDMKIGLHGHLSETLSDVDLCLEKYGKRPIQWISELGFVGSDVWFAHLVHCNEAELRLLAETGTGMAHCPQSNCRLGSGIAPADRLDALGGQVSLGVDGAASNEACDMISEMHCAWHVHRAAKGAGVVRAEDIVRWATAGGANVLRIPTVGSVEVGKSADLAIYDIGQLRYAGLHDPLVGPVICGGQPIARHVLVQGRAVVQDGTIPGLDMAGLCARVAGVVRKLAAS